MAEIAEGYNFPQTGGKLEELFDKLLAWIKGGTLGDKSESVGSLVINGEDVEQTLNGKYAKPSTGIPKSDLASDVQASLNKADTALQEHQDISGKVNKSGDTINGSLSVNGDVYIGGGDIHLSSDGSDGDLFATDSSDNPATVNAGEFIAGSHKLTNKANVKDVNDALAGKASTAVATTTANGLMSAYDYTRLSAASMPQYVAVNRGSSAMVDVLIYPGCLLLIECVKLGGSAYDGDDFYFVMQYGGIDAKYLINDGFDFTKGEVVYINPDHDKTVEMLGTQPFGIKTLTIKAYEDRAGEGRYGEFRVSTIPAPLDRATQYSMGLMSSTDKSRLDAMYQYGKSKGWWS